MKKIAFIVLSAIAFAAVGCKENGLVPEEEKPVLVETVTLDKNHSGRLYPDRREDT